ncbi:MAG: hypothetical protein WEG36_04995 [Gemmatimonadota bacterium]
MRLRILMGLGAVTLTIALGADQVEAQRLLILVGGPVFASTDHENASSKTGLFVAAGTSFLINERFSIDPFVGFPITDSIMGALGAAADFGLTELFEDFEEKSRTYFLYASVAIPLGGT